MKVCTKCHIEKDESEFYLHSGNRLRAECKYCWGERAKKRRDSKKEEIREWFKIYHANNRNKRNHLHRECYKKNRDAYIKRAKIWASINKEKLATIRRKYQEKLTDGYLKNRLVVDGYDLNEIQKIPFLIDKKKLDILVSRARKLIKKHKIIQK